MTNTYDDIIHLPRHTSSKHPQMSRENRAAQFSPFAALTGYEAAIVETARLTDGRMELDEDSIADLNRRLHLLADKLADHPEVCVTYFLLDEKKEGGQYVTEPGRVKKIDAYESVLVLMDGKRIAIGDVVKLEGELFQNWL